MKQLWKIAALPMFGLLVGMLVSPGLAQNWYKIYQSKSSEPEMMYVDRGTLQVKDGKVYYWTWTYSTFSRKWHDTFDKKEGGLPQDDYFYHVLDCRTGEDRFLDGYTFVYHSGKLVKEPKPEGIVGPGEMIAKILKNSVCPMVHL